MSGSSLASSAAQTAFGSRAALIFLARFYMSSFGDLAPLFICMERWSLTVLPLIIRGVKALHRENSVTFSENRTQRNFPLPILWAENLPVTYESVELDKAIKKKLSPLFDCPVCMGGKEAWHMAAT